MTESDRSKRPKWKCIVCYCAADCGTLYLTMLLFVDVAGVLKSSWFRKERKWVDDERSVRMQLACCCYY